MESLYKILDEYVPILKQKKIQPTELFKIYNQRPLAERQLVPFSMIIKIFMSLDNEKFFTMSREEQISVLIEKFVKFNM